MPDDPGKARILVVEDEMPIRRGLVMNLRGEGYDVSEADCGEDGLRQALEWPPDLLILDIMLPDLSGLDVLQSLREADVQVPVLILSARDRIVDKVDGLELGADDYVTKPFRLLELLARVRAHLRRAGKGAAQKQLVRLGDVEIDREARAIRRRGAEVTVTPKAFSLLEHLLDAAGRARSREQLLTRVWGWDYEGTPRTVDNFVRSLRLAIEPDPDHPTYLVTVRGVGYRLDLPRPAR